MKGWVIKDLDTFHVLAQNVCIVTVCYMQSIGSWYATVVDSEIMEAEKKKAGQTDTVDSYEAAFQRIREITNEEDIDRIVCQFIEVEDENFALFNFVNDQNNRIEYLQDEIDEVC